MKRLLKIIGTFIISFLFITNVDAASANVSVSTSANQVIVGKGVTVYVTVSSASPIGSWEYTLNYDTSVFKLTSSEVGLHYASYASNASTKSVTYKYNFTALKSGSCNFYVDSVAVVGWDETIFSASNGSKKVYTLTYAEYQASLSNNNNLKNLEVEGYEITPEFDKDTLEYQVKVNEDEKSIKVNATPEDGSASVNGDGELEVSAGNNTFDIVVIAENGSEKTYKLNVEVIDKDPINVKVDGNNYTVVKISDNLVKPESFNESKVVINGFEIPAFYSEMLEFTLVGLKDSQGIISLFIYKDGHYTKYVELNFGNITVYPLEIKDLIKGYTKGKVKIQNNEVESLSIKSTSRNKLIYGMNVESAEKGYFIYDSKDNTLIKYDTEYIDIINNKVNILTYLSIAFGAATLLALITLICTNKKKKRKIKEIKKEEQVEEKEPEEVKEDTKEIIIENKTITVKDKNVQEVDVNEIIEETTEPDVYNIFEDDKKRKKKRKSK